LLGGGYRGNLTVLADNATMTNQEIKVTVINTVKDNTQLYGVQVGAGELALGFGSDLLYNQT
jgi:hypothetical protein